LAIIQGDPLQFVIKKVEVTSKPDDFTPLADLDALESSETDESVSDELKESEVELESDADISDDDKGWGDPLRQFKVKVYNMTPNWNVSVGIYFQDWWAKTNTVYKVIRPNYLQKFWWNNNFTTYFGLFYHNSKGLRYAKGPQGWWYNGYNQTMTCRIKSMWDNYYLNYLPSIECKPGDYTRNQIWW